jgi:uncharacterized repeat protein (TIGR03803 family)
MRRIGMNGASLVFAVALLVTTLWAAPQERVLHSFNQNGKDGYAPLAPLIQHAGKFYGTTYGGGSHGDLGTVFSMERASGVWKESVLYSFAGGSDGANPYFSGVVFDAAGNMYGTTQLGGGGNGTVFKLTPSGSGWIESVLYSFTGGSDGGDPVSSVILDAAGNLYGTTGDGGDLTCNVPYGCGTVFELSPQGDGTWTESVLHMFTGGSDGAFPLASLIFDQTGSLYGSTYGGGTHNAGTVFELTPSASGWTEAVLFSFTGGRDGKNPQAALISDTLGNLYSTTEFGGVYHLGTVFELTPSNSGWTESVLHSLAGQKDGLHPLSGLTLDQSGNLYGATYGGGGSGRGIVFELEPSGQRWTEIVLLRFTNKEEGAYPTGLVLGQDGDLYGTTQFGGIHNWGTVFKLAP